MKLITAGLEHYDYIFELNKLIHLDFPEFKWDTKEYILEEISLGKCYLAQEKDKFIGLISLQILGDSVYIDKIIVNKNSQKLGLGKSLVNFAIDWTKNCNKNELIVESFCKYNVSEFYKRCGFQQKNDLGNYYGHSYHIFSMNI